MKHNEPRKRAHWPFMLLAASVAGLLLALGFCAAGFRSGSTLQSFAGVSILLFVISAIALVAAVITVIIELTK